MPPWLLPNSLPQMRVKSKRRNICIGEQTKRVYTMTPRAIKARQECGLNSSLTEAERRDRGKRAAALRWGKYRIPTL